MKRKPKSMRKKLIDQLDKLASAYIKLRDDHTCQRCGKREVGSSSIHVSHVIPKSRGQRYRWEPNNMKCLCFHCHINWWHVDIVPAAEWYLSKFPGRWASLFEIPTGKMSVTDLEELRDWYIRAIENFNSDVPDDELGDILG